LFCGPLLTAVLFNPDKTKTRTVADLGFGCDYSPWRLLMELHQGFARPIFLVMEIDRSGQSMPDLDSNTARAELNKLRDHLVGFWSGPVVVGIRPLDARCKGGTVRIHAKVAGLRSQAHFISLTKAKWLKNLW
jgi:hypothetical protein